MTVSETAQTTDWILQPVNISIKNFNKHTGRDKVAILQLKIIRGGKGWFLFLPYFTIIIKVNISIKSLNVLEYLNA